ncbi:alpha/beta hydrolase [Rossellomorea aquimaris]|uniref:alpha/beta hydrolase n=1 Tax=Rossellomorea aquimaris TaxID=189382 RepID=UPI001CD3D2D2|nr:alpha/beta hydrolase [Rossellomorea aquimaris]MCA1055370.1 alpha/beta hydrolase [Rossellomorea aquimaris]
MKSTSSSVTGFKGKQVPYNLLTTTEHPRGLAIFFPGMGYSVMGPLLHYPTGIFLNEGWDVLHINYHYHSDDVKELSDDEFDEVMKDDCQNVIDAVLEKRAYDAYSLIGKSVGTIPMGNELQRECFKDANVIWLTPLHKVDSVHAAMKERGHKGILFIGDHDRHYDEGRFGELASNPDLQLHLIPRANHSLEHDFHVLKSIDIHKSIMTAIERFIKEA